MCGGIVTRAPGPGPAPGLGPVSWARGCCLGRAFDPRPAQHFRFPFQVGYSFCVAVDTEAMDYGGSFPKMRVWWIGVRGIRKSAQASAFFFQTLAGFRLPSMPPEGWLIKHPETLTEKDLWLHLEESGNDDEKSKAEGDFKSLRHAFNTRVNREWPPDVA